MPEGTTDNPGARAEDNSNELVLALQQRDDMVREQVTTELMDALTGLGMGREGRSPAAPDNTESLNAANAGGQQPVPAGSGARTNPAWAADSRYRAIPHENGGDVRTPEGDLAIKEFFVALAHNDRAALARINAKSVEDHKRQLLIGATDADSGLAAGSGGPLVPLPLSNLLLAILQRNATMRQISQVFNSPATTLRVVLQDAHVTAGWTAENAPISASNANYADKLLTKKKLTVLTVASNELIADSAFNVANLIGTEAGQTMAAEEDDALCTSDGSANKPTEGLDVFAGTLAGTHRIAGQGLGNAYVTPNHLISMFFGVHKPYRTNGVWAAPDDVLAILSQLTDNQKRPILQLMTGALNVVTDQYPSAIGTIFNRPIVEIPSGAGNLYFGDFRRAYMILDGSPISAMASEHAGFANDNVQFRFIRRVDGRGGQPGDPDQNGTRRTFVYTDGITAASTDPAPST